MLLAIDTSAGTSVAVVDREAGILSEHSVADTMRHAEVIGDLIAASLTDAGVSVSQLSGVAAGMGPGPFTGLRVGIAAARTFALGANKPVVPVVSHDAIAFDNYRHGHTGGMLVVTDARRRELYWSAYVGVDEWALPLREDGPGLCKPDDVPHPHLQRVDATVVSAGSLGMLAELLFAHGRAFAADEPLYLRSPDVTVSKGRKRVTG
jgi:tRNA threonylcarbamoyl adenosine modification protein YeaZ